MVKRCILHGSKGQVWVETVVYTLIALVIIGAVIAFANPKIEETRDRAVIEQTISLMNNVEQIVSSVVQGGAGNKRIIDLRIRKGEIEFNPSEDKIVFRIDSNDEYSQPDTPIDIGNLEVLTVDKGEVNEVTVTRDYNGIYNLTYNGDDSSSNILKSSPNVYRVSVENKGKDFNSEPVLDFSTI